MKRGFITISNSIIVTIGLALLGAIFTTVSATSTKEETVAKELRDVDTTQNADISGLKANVITLQNDTTYTRARVDEIYNIVSKK